MAVTEQSRYNVHKHFETTMGEELAATLMELLPSVGWADVARRRDLQVLDQRLDGVDRRLDAFEAKVDARFAAVESKIDALRDHMDDEFRKNLFASISISCTIVGLVGAAARFL